MSPLDSILLVILFVVVGMASIATSLGRIARGGTQALGGIASLVLLGGLLVLILVVALAFQHVSSVIGPASSNPVYPTQYTPIPWSTVPGFGTPNTGPGITVGP